MIVEKFDMTYEGIKKIVTQNPDITAQEFGEKLKQSGTTDAKIFDLLADIINLEKQGTLDDYSVFLKIVELFAQLDIQVKKSSGGRTMLDIAVTNNQADVVRILLNSGKFNEEEKFNALGSAIVQGNVQEFKLFLDYVDHASIQNHLNAAPCNENTDIMKVLLDNKRFTEKEKVQAPSHASIDGDLPKVRLFLKYMTGIPESGIRNLLEMIKESKSPFEEELRIGSEFKVDFSNSDHCTYLSNRVMIALLRSTINKKQNTPNVKENGAGFSGSNRNSDSVRNLYTRIARTINSINFESLQTPVGD